MKFKTFHDLVDAAKKQSRAQQEYNEDPCAETFENLNLSLSKKDEKLWIISNDLIKQFNQDFVDLALCPLIQTHAVGSVDEFYASCEWCLVLSGGVGSGKTIAAVNCLIQHVTQRDVDWKILFAVDIACAPIFGKEGEEYFKPIAESEFLLIDDLGSEIDTPGSRAFISRLIDFRHRRDLRTVITTNLAMPAWIPRYGSRIVDRVTDNSAVVELPNKSMRGQKWAK